ncbi:MAG: sugar ABC transporter ATP-binding protein [Chthoniobacteraceae bacterium]
MNNALLKLDGITKSFFGVEVLREITFSVERGETLGLVGENGAGKSTLMNLLGGNLQPDRGAMWLDGHDYTPHGARDAVAAGIAFIHQELNLFPNLTIAENIFLTSFPTAGPVIRRGELRARAQALLAQVELAVPPETPVEQLSAGERQLVEIAKALRTDARLIIFDEPTTSLTTRESEHLFGLIERLQQRGVSIIYISHTLADVRRICQRIAVLRDGEVVGQGAAGEFTIDRMVSLMVGRTISQFFPARPATISDEAALEVKGISQPGIVESISFTLRRGEVLGISGLMGSGRSELARILFGLDPRERGTIRVAGKTLVRDTPRDRIRRGVAFLTEDRRAEGLCLDASIADNIALVTLPSNATRPLRLLDFGKMRQAVALIRDAVRLTPGARDEQPVRTLSGGNQQKVVLAKWLLLEPSVLILDEPTRGIDVGAKSEIYQLINERAAGGAGVLVISSEIEELIGICDRILVMRRGEISDELHPGGFDRERLLRSALSEGAQELT